MHNLHLGVTKMSLLLTSVWVRSALRRVGKIINQMNDGQCEADTFPQNVGIKLYFSNSGKDEHLHGLFTKDIILEMLEFNEYENIEAVLPILGLIGDRAVDSCPLNIEIGFSLHIAISSIKHIVTKCLKIGLLKTSIRHRVLYLNLYRKPAPSSKHSIHPV